MTMTSDIQESTQFHSTLAGAPVEVSDEGGKFGGGYIMNFSVIKRGPAKGHGLWVDDEFLDQVQGQMLAATGGVKSRYTHPEKRDSLSRGLGRVFFRAREDGEIRADLHFWKAARKTPHGDLASHLIQLAQDDPEAFGSSISFNTDVEATLDAKIDNEFGSPHVRLRELKFIDLVDSPATSPNGLFSEADETYFPELAYAFGLTEHKPEASVLGVEPDTLFGFISRFMETRGLEIVKLNLQSKDGEFEETVVDGAVDTAVETEAPVADAQQEPEVQPEPEAQEEPVAEDKPEGGHFTPAPEAEKQQEGGHFSREDLEAYVTEFGKADGVDYFMEGLDFRAAQSKHIGKLNEDIKGLKDQLELSAQTEDTPFSAGPETPGNERKGFKSSINLS